VRVNLLPGWLAGERERGGSARGDGVLSLCICW
jgi:hypothetical protein